MPSSQVDERSGGYGSAAMPPPVQSRMSDEIDYKIFGEDMQYVEVELDPGESAVAEAGSMMFKDSVVSLDTVFGQGFTMQKLKGVGLVFIHAGGKIHERELKAGESIQVDTGCPGRRTVSLVGEVEPNGFG